MSLTVQIQCVVLGLIAEVIRIAEYILHRL
jgi:hypothetical protein